jgi:hypothetical protein
MPPVARRPEERDCEDIEDDERDLSPPQELRLRRRIEEDAEQHADDMFKLLEDL